MPVHEDSTQGVLIRGQLVEQQVFPFMEREKLSRDTTDRCAEKTQLPTPCDCMPHSIRTLHSPSPRTPLQCPFCTEDMFSCPSAKGQHMSCGTRVCNNVVGTNRWRSHSMAGTNWGIDDHSRQWAGTVTTLGLTCTPTAVEALWTCIPPSK